MSIVVYVEQLNEDKSIGATANQAMMLENAGKFKMTFEVEGLRSPDDLTAFVFQAGRYIAVVALDSNKVPLMMFLDLKNNEEYAKRIATQFGERLRRMFMKNFYELSKNY